MNIKFENGDTLKQKSNKNQQNNLGGDKSQNL